MAIKSKRANVRERLNSQMPKVTSNTLEKLYDCMEKLEPRLELPKEIIERARLPIERMLEISARP